MAVKPGPKTPQKYGGKVGPNYLKWGELEYAGYAYNPTTDKYSYDPMVQARYEAAAKKKLEEEFGEKPKEPPGPFEQGLAAAVPGLATIGAKYLLSKDGREWAGGLLGLGGSSGWSNAATSLDNAGLLDIGNTAKSAWDSVSDYSGDAWDAVSDWGSDAWDAVSDAGSDVVDWFAGLFG